MKEGHSFGKEHGFTGSAGKDMHPTIPGFKRGGHLKKIPMIEPSNGSNDDEMSQPSMPQPPAMMKHGGKVGGHGHYDTHMKHDQVKYDEHGFQSHKNHK